MEKNKCTFCKQESDKCTVGYINNYRVLINYEGVEKTNEAKIFICEKNECSLKYRIALNEIDHL